MAVALIGGTLELFNVVVVKGRRSKGSKSMDKARPGFAPSTPQLSDANDS